MPIPEARQHLIYIAANVRRLRARAGLTQERLAELTGFDIRFLQKIERGRLNISMDTFVRLARALDTQPGVLLRKAKLAPPAPGRPKRRTRPGARKRSTVR